MEIRIALSQIRRGLGRPHESEIDDSDLLLELWQSLSYFRSVLDLTHEAWSIRRWNFFVDPGSPTEKNLNADSFGSSIFVTSKDDTNPYFIKRTINVVRPEQMSMYYSGPSNLPVTGSWWTPHVAQAFSIFNENGQWKIQWLPQHQESAEYTLWYVQGCPTSPPLFADNTNYPIEEMNWLVISDCIVNLFPFLADEKTGLNQKQQGLLQVAQKKIQQWNPILEAKRYDGPRREPTQRRKVFGQRRSGGSNFY